MGSVRYTYAIIVIPDIGNCATGGTVALRYACAIIVTYFAMYDFEKIL